MKALLLVDIQNDFLPGGALAVPEGDRVIPVANKLQGRFSLVVATQDWHPANHGSFAANHPGKKPFEQIELNGLPQTLWPVHCVQQTKGAELASGLDSGRIARVFRKGADPGLDSYSGFFDNGHRLATGLGEWLKSNEVTEVYVCGLATDYCVKFTALDALRLGFKTHLILDACRGVNLRPDDISRAVDEMAQAGVSVTQSGEVFKNPVTPPLRTTLFAGKFLSLVREGHWEYAERVKVNGAAIIVAVTEEEKLLLVEQYRIPVHARTIEMPAGIIGDECGTTAESNAEAARRELLEETGYIAEHLEELTRGASSSGLASEIVVLFRATGLRRVSNGGGVEHEEITVHEVPLGEAHDWLAAKSRAGLLIDPKVYAGLYFLESSRISGVALQPMPTSPPAG